MNALVWDEGLEAVATYWAHQCDYAHHNNVNSGEQNDMYQVLCDDGDCLAVGYDDQWIGENLGASGTSSSSPNWDIDDILARIESWYDESEDYHWNTQTEFGVVGHWTQGVWAKTRYLGCGYAACDGSTSPWNNGWNWFYVVCKYFPGGNYNNQQPYTSGTQCSDCDSDRTECEGDYSGLCGGDICLNCAADFFQNACTYEEDTCSDYVEGGEVIASDTDTDSDTGSDTGSGTGSDTDSDTDTGAEPDAENQSSVSWIGQRSHLPLMLCSALAILC